MPYLGFDIGGTHGRAEWWPADAGPAGEHEGVQPAVLGAERAAERLAAIVADAVRGRPVDAVVCAVAGAGDAATRAALREGVRMRLPDLPIAVVPDLLAAAAAGVREGPGALLWAGTGSFAIARGADDRLWRVGGRGWLAGDQGSAFDLVRRALQAALLALDELDDPTDLLPALVAAFDAPAGDRLGAVAQRLPPREIAARAPNVLAVHRCGDPVAGRVVAAAVQDLVRQADGAAARAGLRTAELRLALGGGLLGEHGPLFEEVRRRAQDGGAWAGVRSLGGRAAAEAAAWLAHGWHLGLEPQRSWVEHVPL